MTILPNIFVACALALVRSASSFHHGLQLPGSDTKASDAGTASSLPSSTYQRQPSPETRKLDSSLVNGIFSSPRTEAGAVATLELNLQGFGHKCYDCDDGPLKPAAPPSVEIADPPSFPALQSDGPMDNFFQVSSEQTLVESPETPDDDSGGFALPTLPLQKATDDVPERGAKAEAVTPPHPRSVGEVAPQANGTAKVGEVALRENITAPGVISAKVVGVVDGLPEVVPFNSSSSGLDQPPPALTEVLPLPFDADGSSAAAGGHIHVSAMIATQDSRQEVITNGSTKTNGTPDKSEASKSRPAIPTNVTTGVVLSQGGRGRSHAGEPLAIEGAASTAPSANAKTEVRAERLGSPSAPMKKLDLPTQVEGRTGGNTVLFGFLAIVALAVLGGLCLVCLGAGFVASLLWQRQLGNPTRSRVELLPLCRASDVERLLPTSAGYDCIFSKPLSSCQLLRLEARVEGPAVGTASLTAPLTGQACVLYSAAVSRQLHDGIRPAPVAFASAGVDFTIVLTDAPHVRINVSSAEVSLFDMRHGKCVQRQTFAASPDKWQDFILTHRAGTEWQTSSQLRADASSLEFQECALLSGTVATFVGELHRGTDGALSLRPLPGDASAAKGALPCDASPAISERWRTSWECGGCEVANVNREDMSPKETAEFAEAPFEKVLASDDPLLLEGASLLEAGASLLNGVGSMLAALPAKCSAGATALMAVRKGGKRTPL